MYILGMCNGDWLLDEPEQDPCGLNEPDQAFEGYDEEPDCKACHGRGYEPMYEGTSENCATCAGTGKQ
jgi:hypothetical protein